MHHRPHRLLSALLTLCSAFMLLTNLPLTRGGAPSSTSAYLPLVTNDSLPAIVFVSRQLLPEGSIYWEIPKGMPGVGPFSRFSVVAPGKLLVREPDGSIRTLVDGANPAANAFQLIDVNAPAVSYDGRTIAFAGLPSGSHLQATTVNNPGAWRIYTIKADGSDLRQVTFSNQQLDMSQFGPAAGGLDSYDDTDPAWLPDGRLVFSSTRWPSYAQYSGVRASNLYVVNADGTDLHRITAERNGADRPLVDPLTGKIVYARWWRNHRFAINDMSTIPNPQGGFLQKDGLSTDRNNQIDGTEEYNDLLWRNAWHAATINPDGTGLAMWSGTFRSEEANHVYGGDFTYNGDLIASFHPMFNMTEAAGFGGLRRYHRGAVSYEPIIGVTRLSRNYVHESNPTSFGILQGTYATDPAVMPSGRLVFSYAADVGQDYGLYTSNPDGSGLRLLYDAPGTTELRARLVMSRPLPPIIPDSVTQTASLLPPTSDPATFRADGTFVFDALNVYANAPVDTEIVNAPPVGSAATIRFFLDHQRTSQGSFPSQDWPILLGQLAVNPDGSVRDPSAPANVPLFEQLRSADGTVPLTVGPADARGAAHVAGMNFGRPGSTVRCVGCHAGHTMIPVPENPADAQWSNLAPGAALEVSSAQDSKYVSGLTDRRVMKGETWRYWRSQNGQTSGQWVELTFQVPVTIRTVRLYNPRAESNTNLRVGQATVRLYSDAAGTVEVAQATSGELSVLGTNVQFDEVRARVVRIEINQVSGRVDGITCASLAEVEVIARGEAP